MSEGRLGPGGVADLLSAVCEQERTGFVDVLAGGVERKFVFADGEVVYLTSSESTEKLPVRLLSRGLLTREALVAAGKAGPDLRAALAASGAVTPEAHDRELRNLVGEVVARAFPLSDGRYVLTDRGELNLPGVLESNPMVPVLWRAARACPPEFAVQFLGDLRQRVVRTGADELITQAHDLTPQEAYLVSRIDGYSSVVDLESLAPVDAPDVHRLVFALCCIGVVDAPNRPGLKLPRPSRTTPGKRKKTSPTTARPAATPAAKPVVAPVVPVEPVTKDAIDGVRETALALVSLDHYGVLGVKSAADEGEIRKAYYALARTYHPDRFGRDLAGADRQLVEDLFARISEAFAVLSDDERRKEYDEKVRSGAVAAEREQEKKPVDKKALARESYEKGRALLSTDRGRALRFLEHAVETDMDTWEYRMALARLLMSDTRTRKRAEIHLQEAIRIDQTKADAYHQLGILYKSAGVKTRALEVLRQGLRWDAVHAGILQEIDEIEGRGGEGSLFGGLFKKK